MDLALMTCNGLCAIKQKKNNLIMINTNKDMPLV